MPPALHECFGLNILKNFDWKNFSSNKTTTFNLSPEKRDIIITFLSAVMK